MVLSPGKSSYLGASFNFINSIVGAGIIGIPYAIGQCGFFTGVFMLTFVAFLVNRSVLMLIKSGIKANRYNLEEVSEYYLGPLGYFASLLFMFLFAYGAQVAYLVIAGDTFPVVFDVLFSSSGVGGGDRTIVTVALAVVIVLPLCLLRDLSSLSWTSFLSVLADTLLIVILVIASPYEARQEHIQTELSFINSGLFAGIGTISFAFVCQHNSFLVFQSLTHQTYEEWTKVAHISIIFSYFLCLIFGLSGYLSFGSFTKGDLLLNFPAEDTKVNVCRFLLGVTMLLTYPMECYVTRHCFQAIISRARAYSTKRSRRQQQVSDVDDDEMNVNVSPLHSFAPINHTTTENTDSVTESSNSLVPLSEHVLVSLVLWGTSLALAISFTDLSIVLALTGALAASMLGYVLPPLVFIFAYKKEFARAVFVAFRVRLFVGEGDDELPSDDDQSKRIQDVNRLAIEMVHHPRKSNSNNNTDKRVRSDPNSEDKSSLLSSSPDESTEEADHEVETTTIRFRSPLGTSDEVEVETEHPDGIMTSIDLSPSAEDEEDLATTSERSRQQGRGDGFYSLLTTRAAIPSLWGRICALQDFYLPLFMIVFGLIALVSGVGTVIAEAM